MTFISYAQNFEDVMLWRALRDVETGNYLDVGAQDPVVDSVSRAFYDAGWRGIHVEPTQHYGNALRENRPDELVVKAVVSADPGLRTFYEIPGTGLSTGVAEIAERHREAGWEVAPCTAPAVTLASLLDQFEGKDIHWLKIDVEGMERDVLRSWGDHPARPWVLVIESTFPNTQEPTHHAWVDEVERRGYQEVYFDGLSRFYLAHGQMQRAAAFSAPPNVFDQFQVERHHFSSGLIRQHEEAMERQTASVEQKAAEQEQARQLELQQRETDHAQREALYREQVESLQNALRELERSQEHFPAEIDRREREIAFLRQQIDDLRASHDAALLQFTSEQGKSEEAHRAHVQGLETALSVAQSAMDRLGVELDRREAELAAIRARWEESQAAALLRIEELRAALSAREGELIASNAAQEATRAAAAEREAQLGHELHQRQEEIATLRQALEQRQAELTHRTARLGEATGLLLNLQSGRLWRRTIWRRMTIDRHELTSFNNQLAEFFSHPPEEDIATQHDRLDHGAKSVTDSNMSIDIPTPNAPRAANLDELLGHHDLAFVRCAYRTVLGREPDPAGESYYLARLRNGVAKLHILRQMRRSAEGRLHDPGITGLDLAIRRYWWARAPIIGSVVKSWIGGESDTFQDRKLRILESSLAKIASEQQQARASQIKFHSETIQHILQGFQRLEWPDADRIAVSANGHPEIRSVTEGFDLSTAKSVQDIFSALKINIYSSIESKNLAQD